MRIHEALAAVATDDDTLIRELSITPAILHRIRTDRNHVKYWLIKRLLDDYRINPLYIYGHSDNLFIS